MEGFNHMVESLSKFLTQVGNDSFHRVLEFFLEGRDLDFSKHDVCEDTSVARSTLDRIWDERFMMPEILKKTREVGNKTQLYALNKENTFVKMYLQLFDFVVFDIVPEPIKPVTKSVTLTLEDSNVIYCVAGKKVVPTNAPATMCRPITASLAMLSA